MYSNQKPLRELAQAAMRAEGFTKLDVVRGSGGARLQFVKSRTAGLALVRTSSDRWVGWMRDSAGELRGLDKAAIVVVAALNDKKTPTKAEVYAFSPADVRVACKAVMAVREAQSPNNSKTAPVFVSLDPREPKVFGNLKAKALWKHELPLSGTVEDSQAQMAASETIGQLDAISLSEAKRRLAITFGVPPENIDITIRG